jgi:hypothetical protein
MSALSGPFGTGARSEEVGQFEPLRRLVSASDQA